MQYNLMDFLINNDHDCAMHKLYLMNAKHCRNYAEWVRCACYMVSKNTPFEKIFICQHKCSAEGGGRMMMRTAPIERAHAYAGSGPFEMRKPGNGVATLHDIHHCSWRNLKT